MADEKKTAVMEAGDEAPALRRRVDPLRFAKEVRREISKITWPSWKETYLTTIMVFIMVGITMAFFFGVDTLFNYGEMLLIGARRLF